MASGSGNTAWNTSSSFSYTVPEDDDIKIVSISWSASGNSEYDPGDVILYGTCNIYQNDTLLQSDGLYFRAFKKGSTYNVYSNVTSTGNLMLDVQSGDVIRVTIANNNAANSTERYFGFGVTIACIHLNNY